jgi:hypothetical protein
MARQPDDPFLRMDSVRYEDIVADGFVELLRHGGVDGLTMKALAAWMKVTPSAVTHRARWPATIEHFLSAMARRWIQWSAAGLRSVRPLPSVPMTMAERHGVRCWYLAGELARTEAAAGRPGALETWEWAMAADEELLHEWWVHSVGSAAGFDRFRLHLTGARLALAMDPSLPASQARADLVRRAPQRVSREPSTGSEPAAALNPD